VRVRVRARVRARVKRKQKEAQRQLRQLRRRQQAAKRGKVVREENARLRFLRTVPPSFAPGSKM
jgi:hypothetical protein